MLRIVKIGISSQEYKYTSMCYAEIRTLLDMLELCWMMDMPDSLAKNIVKIQVTDRVIRKGGMQSYPNKSRLADSRRMAEDLSWTRTQEITSAFNKVMNN